MGIKTTRTRTCKGSFFVVLFHGHLLVSNSQIKDRNRQCHHNLQGRAYAVPRDALEVFIHGANLEPETMVRSEPFVVTSVAMERYTPAIQAHVFETLTKCCFMVTQQHRSSLTFVAYFERLRSGLKGLPLLGNIFQITNNRWTIFTGIAHFMGLRYTNSKTQARRFESSSVRDLENFEC